MATRPPIGIQVSSDAWLTGSDEGVTTENRFVRFLVHGVPAGDDTVRLAPDGWFTGDDGVEEATFDFTIPG